MKNLLFLFLFLLSTAASSYSYHSAEELLQKPQYIDKDLESLYSSSLIEQKAKANHIDSLLKLKSHVAFLPLEDAPLNKLVLLAQQHQWKKTVALAKDLASACDKGLELKDCKYLISKIYDLVNQNDLDPIKLHLFLIELKNAEQIINVLYFYSPLFISKFNKQVSALTLIPQSIPSNKENSDFVYSHLLLTKVTALIGLFILGGLFFHSRLNKRKLSPLANLFKHLPPQTLIAVQESLKQLFFDNSDTFHESKFNLEKNDSKITLYFTTHSKSFSLKSLVHAQELLQDTGIELSFKCQCSATNKLYFVVISFLSPK